jgi:mRNA-degrading endonuclease YafQ of YafQ-DinJ toxin-antitoxin module
MNATEKRYQQDVLALTGKNKKYLVELYKERFETIRKMYDHKEIVTANEPNGYLQSLFSEIVRSNPALQPLEARVAFSRAWWPNASSMGEGTILFNIGLFHKLQNESQAAFVICHELAHLYLRHSNNSIDRFVNTVHSEEFQKELKRIEKSQYKQGQQLNELVKTLSFRSRKHSREYEAQADSMALEWMKNTSFDVQEVLTCLSLLDSVDGDKYRVSPAVDRVLNCKEFPFQAKWIKEEKSLFGAMAANSEEEAKKDQDSLKTHPDCSLRISKLSGKVQQYRHSNSRAFVVNEKLFHKLQNDFDFEIIDYCYRSGNISRSFYYTLQMLQLQPANAYLITNVGRCLNELYAVQKAHTLSNSADLPSPYNDERYNTLLHFIQRVRLPDIAALSYYFLQTHQQNLSASEEFLAALINSKANFNKPEEKQQWTEVYNKQFPQGKYKF